jgi:hypothetical protein
VFERLAILGFGNMELGGAICASLANFYGERPLEIRVWDPIKERADIMARVLRYFFKSVGLEHQVYSMASMSDVMFEPNAVIICLGRESVDPRNLNLTEPFVMKRKNPYLTHTEPIKFLSGNNEQIVTNTVLLSPLEAEHIEQDHTVLVERLFLEKLLELRGAVPVKISVFDVCLSVQNGWPPAPAESSGMPFKFQTLRWINKEEHPAQYIYGERESPLVSWLNRL